MWVIITTYKQKYNMQQISKQYDIIIRTSIESLSFIKALETKNKFHLYIKEKEREVALTWWG